MHAAFVLPSSTRECRPVSINHTTRSHEMRKESKPNARKVKAKAKAKKATTTTSTITTTREEEENQPETRSHEESNAHTHSHSVMPATLSSTGVQSTGVPGHAPSMSTSTEASTLVASARSSAGPMNATTTIGKSRPVSDLSAKALWPTPVVRCKIPRDEGKHQPRPAGEDCRPKGSESVKNLVAFLEETTPPVSEEEAEGKRGGGGCLKKKSSSSSQDKHPRDSAWNTWRGNHKRNKRLRQLLQSRQDRPAQWVTRTTVGGKMYQQIFPDPTTITAILEQQQQQSPAMGEKAKITARGLETDRPNMHDVTTMDDNKENLTDDQMEIDSIDFYFPDTPRKGPREARRTSIRDFAEMERATSQSCPPPASDEIRRSAFEHDLLKELDALGDSYGDGRDHGVHHGSRDGYVEEERHNSGQGQAPHSTTPSNTLVPKPLTFTIAQPEARGSPDAVIKPQPPAKVVGRSPFATNNGRYHHADRQGRVFEDFETRGAGQLLLQGVSAAPNSNALIVNHGIQSRHRKGQGSCGSSSYSTTSASSRGLSVRFEENHGLARSESGRCTAGTTTAVKITQPLGPDPFYTESHFHQQQQNQHQFALPEKSLWRSLSRASRDTVENNHSTPASDGPPPPPRFLMKSAIEPESAASRSASPSDVTQMTAENGKPGHHVGRPRQSMSPVYYAAASSDPPHPAPTSPLPSLPEGAASPTGPDVLSRRFKKGSRRRQRQQNGSLSSSQSSSQSWSPTSPSHPSRCINMPKSRSGSKSLASPVKFDHSQEGASGVDARMSTDSSFRSSVMSIQAQCKKREDRVKALKQRDTAAARARHENRLLEEREKQAAEAARRKAKEVAQREAKEAKTQISSPKIPPFARASSSSRISLKSSDSCLSLRQKPSFRKPITLAPIVTVHDQPPVAPPKPAATKPADIQAISLHHFQSLGGAPISHNNAFHKSLRRERSAPTNLSSLPRQISPKTAAAAGCHTPPRSASPSLESSDEDGCGRSSRRASSVAPLSVAQIGCFPLPGRSGSGSGPTLTSNTLPLRRKSTTTKKPRSKNPLDVQDTVADSGVAWTRSHLFHPGSDSTVDIDPALSASSFYSSSASGIGTPVTNDLITTSTSTTPHPTIMSHDANQDFASNFRAEEEDSSPRTSTSPSTNPSTSEIVARLAYLERQNKMLQAMVIAAVGGAKGTKGGPGADALGGVGIGVGVGGEGLRGA